MALRNVKSTLAPTIFALVFLAGFNLHAGDGLEAVKDQLTDSISLSEKFLDKAAKLTFKLVPQGEQTNQQECRQVAKELNTHLQFFKFERVVLHKGIGKEVRGVDFCYENAINAARQDAFVSINPRFIYLTEGNFVSQTGLRATKALTLNYHVGGVEQFLIDSKNRVVQFSYQRVLLGKPKFTARVTTALTREGHVISRQIQLLDGKVVSTNLRFSSANGLVMEATRSKRLIGQTPVEEFLVSTVDPAEGLKPVITVLGALVTGAEEGERIMNVRGLVEPGTFYEGSQGATWPKRVLSYGIDKTPTKTCEKALISDHGNDSSVGDTECFKDLLAR